MRKRILIFTTLLLLFGSRIHVNAETVTGINPINNYSPDISYKISKDRLKDIYNKIPRSSMFTEVLDFSDSKNVQGLGTELSYLVENNILSRDVNITANGNELQLDYSAYGNQLISTSPSKVSRSDFLMGLAKASYGIKESRPIIVTSWSQRQFDGQLQNITVTNRYKPVGYSGKDSQFDFSEGDYNIYISPNVYELYFKILLDKGIIKLSSFKDIEFQNAYKSYGQNVNGIQMFPRWAPELGIYSPMKYFSDYNHFGMTKSKPLGVSFTVPDSDYKSEEYKLSQYFIKRDKPDYFMDETITTMDAFKNIESILRATEKNMTSTESKIVTYKYGLSHISKFNASDRETIMFLIAKGIINFENKEELGNLYNELSSNYFITLLYRLHNKNARTDFSAIQLTDSDNFWLERGFGQTDVSVYKSSASPYVHTKFLETNKVAQETSWFNKLLSNLSNIAMTALNKVGISVADNGIKYRNNPVTLYEYKIQRIFPNSTMYKYKGTRIQDLAVGDTVTDVKKNKNNIEVTFTIKSINRQSAIAILDSNTQVNAVNLLLEGSMTGVSKVEGGNEGNATFVAATSLSKYDSEIRIINDKHLRNVKTGTEALLLQDNKTALIGNEVVKTEELMVFGINNEVYYNLKIISTLMSNTYINSIDPFAIFVTEGINNEEIAKVQSRDGSAIGSTIIAEFDEMLDSNNWTTDKDTYSLTHTSRGLTTLIRSFNYMDATDNSEKNLKMIVEWSYVLPLGDTTLSGYSSNTDATVKQISEFVFTRPTNPELADWWDSNIELSNALVNRIYDTSGVTYVRSGYLTPSVTILHEEDLTDEIRKSIFGTLALSTTYRDNYMSSAPVLDFRHKLFNQPYENKNIRTRLQPARVYRELKGTARSGYMDFGGSYALANNKAIFRVIEDDTRVEYDKSKKVLFVKTRTPNPSVNKEGSIVRFDGRTFYHDGYSNGGATMRLIAVDFFREGTVVGATNNHSLDNNGFGALAMFKSDFSSVLTGKHPFITDGAGLSKLPPPQYLSDGLYLSQGKVYEVESDGDSIASISIVQNPKGRIAKAHPVIHLDQSLYSVSPSGEITRSATIIEAQGNIFYSGINASIIDSIIAKSADYKPLSELSPGTKVILGDNMYLSNGRSLTSYPIYNSSLVSDVSSSPKDASSLRAPLLKYYTGLNVEVAGRPYSFTSYIEEIGLGPARAVSKYERTLTYDGKLLVREQSTNKSYSSGDSIKSVVVQLKLSPDILVRSVDNSTDTYAVVMYSKKGSDGYIDNIPFLNETLGLTMQDDIFLNLAKANYKAVDNVKELMKQFKDLYRLAVRGDIKAIFKSITFTILAYMIVISWLCFMIIKFKIGYELLRSIKYPFRDSDTKGIDILKVVSFGMYDIDAPVSTARMLGATLLMFIIIYLVIGFL